MCNCINEHKVVRADFPDGSDSRVFIEGAAYCPWCGKKYASLEADVDELEKTIREARTPVNFFFLFRARARNIMKTYRRPYIPDWVELLANGKETDAEFVIKETLAEMEEQE